VRVCDASAPRKQKVGDLRLIFRLRAGYRRSWHTSARCGFWTMSRVLPISPTIDWMFIDVLSNIQ
jgi:hypothetical protein